MDNRRQPYIEKKIHKLSENDNYVAVSGMIISKADSGFTIDDGRETLLVSYPNLEYSKDTYVRVFGRVIPRDHGFIIQADFIQDISKMDRFLYDKVKDLLT